MQGKILSRKEIVALPQNIVFNTEILRERRPNSTSRLWVQNDGTIFKQYVFFNELTKQNTDNLLRIVSSKKMHKIPELSMPLAVYERDEKSKAI